MTPILLSKETRAIVQGITGKVGRVQTHWMIRAGTLLAGGVTPGRGGQEVEGLPVYDTVAEAVRQLRANASVIFVGAESAREATLEAIGAGLKLIVIVTEHIPLRDVMEIKARARTARTMVIGPNCPGIFVPGVGKLGIMPESLFLRGGIGIIGRSGTLTYEVIANLTDAGIGQSGAVGIGGDPVVCTEFDEMLRILEDDEATQGVVLVGEIGGSAEERAAEFVATMSKPVVALIAGRTAPPGRRFGHAGAIIRVGGGGAERKIGVLREAGAMIAETPSQIPALLRGCLGGRLASD